MGAASGDFRRQSRVRLPHGKTDHPSDKRRRQSHQQRSADWRQTKGGVHSQLQRQSGADDHSGRGPF